MGRLMTSPRENKIRFETVQSPSSLQGGRRGRKNNEEKIRYVYGPWIKPLVSFSHHKRRSLWGRKKKRIITCNARPLANDLPAGKRTALWQLPFLYPHIKAFFLNHILIFFNNTTRYTFDWWYNFLKLGWLDGQHNELWTMRASLFLSGEGQNALRCWSNLESNTQRDTADYTID